MNGNNEKINSPLVSVIMNCYNSSKYLKEAIDSVYAQTYENWEIIFWDNASTDNSAEIAKSYNDKLKYFRGEKNVVLYAARNYALKKASGKYIAFLDCDDLWFPEKLGLQVKGFQGNDWGFIFTNAEILEPRGSKRIQIYNNKSKVLSFGEIFRNYNIIMQTVMISADVLSKENIIFNETMNYSGDSDLFLKIAYKYKVLYLSEITVQYREHAGSLTADKNKIEKMFTEGETIIDNLQKRDNAFNIKYASEIDSFRRRKLLSIVVAKWKFTNGKEARKVIVDKNSTYNIFLYFLTFLPYSYIHFLWYKIFKNYANK